MTNRSVFRLCACIVFICAAFFSINAQTDRELGEAAIQGIKLFEQQRFTEAIPHFEIVPGCQVETSQRYERGKASFGEGLGTVHQSEGAWPQK